MHFCKIFFLESISLDFPLTCCCSLVSPRIQRICALLLSTRSGWSSSMGVLVGSTSGSVLRPMAQTRGRRRVGTEVTTCCQTSEDRPKNKHHSHSSRVSPVELNTTLPNSIKITWRGGGGNDKDAEVRWRPTDVLHIYNTDINSLHFY